MHGAILVECPRQSVTGSSVRGGCTAVISQGLHNIAVTAYTVPQCACVSVSILHVYAGVSNDFLINTRTETALLYNDISVNENMHLATAFKIMRRPGNDLLEHLPADQYRYFRRVVIQIVLATDMAGHSELLQVCQHNSASMSMSSFTSQKGMLAEVLA